MQDRERRGYDRDLARLLAAVFGSDGERGLSARVYDLERDAAGARSELDMIEKRSRENELRSRDFADHPLLDKGVARRVIDHLTRSDRERADRGALFSRIQGQTVIVVFSIVQTLILAWVAVHVTGVQLPPR